MTDKNIDDYVKVTAWGRYADDGMPPRTFGRKHFINDEESETLCSIRLPRNDEVEYSVEMANGFCKMCLNMVKKAQSQK